MILVFSQTFKSIPGTQSFSNFYFLASLTYLARNLFSWESTVQNLFLTHFFGFWKLRNPVLAPFIAPPASPQLLSAIRKKAGGRKLCRTILLTGSWYPFLSDLIPVLVFKPIRPPAMTRTVQRTRTIMKPESARCASAFTLLIMFGGTLSFWLLLPRFRFASWIFIACTLLILTLRNIHFHRGTHRPDYLLETTPQHPSRHIFVHAWIKIASRTSGTTVGNVLYRFYIISTVFFENLL